MSEKPRADQQPPSDEASEFEAICDELTRELRTKTNGGEYHAALDAWESKHCRRSFGYAVLNEARRLRHAYEMGRKSSPTIQVFGNVTHIETGGGDYVSSHAVVPSVASASIAVIPDNGSIASAPQAPSANRGSVMVQVIVLGLAGLVAAWWVLPASCSLGHARNFITTLVSVPSAVFCGVSYLKFRREIWAEWVLFGAAAFSALRIATPEVLLRLYASDDKASAKIRAYFEITDGSWQHHAVMGAVVVACLAAGCFCTWCRKRYSLSDS